MIVNDFFLQELMRSASILRVLDANFLFFFIKFQNSIDKKFWKLRSLFSFTEIAEELNYENIESIKIKMISEINFLLLKTVTRN